MAKLDRPNPITITPDVAGDLIANYPTFVFRFLFSDGRTMDVYALRDDSDLRAAVLAYAKADRIEGVAKLPAP